MPVAAVSARRQADRQFRIEDDDGRQHARVKYDLLSGAPARR
jgi:hypothetical protein